MWQEEYKRKLTTAEEAVKVIQPGYRVVLGHCCGEPQHLVSAMLNNKEAYENVEIIHMVPMGSSEYCKPENRNYYP